MYVLWLPLEWLLTFPAHKLFLMCSKQHHMGGFQSKNNNIGSHVKNGQWTALCQSSCILLNGFFTFWCFWRRTSYSKVEKNLAIYFSSIQNITTNTLLHHNIRNWLWYNRGGSKYVCKKERCCSSTSSALYKERRCFNFLAA